WLSLVFCLLWRISLRSLKVEFGPSRWPFLSSRSGERTAISSVYWPAYLSVAIIALVIIPLGIYVVAWYPFFARGQFQSISDLVKYDDEPLTEHRSLGAGSAHGY